MSGGDGSLTLLHHEFIKRAGELPRKRAIVDRTTERTVTYEKALIAVLILQRRFRIFPDRYLGIMVPTSAGAFLSILGTLMAGKIPVMINYATGAEDNCRYARGKCGFQTILTSRALLEKSGCPELPGMVCLEDVMRSITFAEKVRAAIRAKLPASWLIGGLPKSSADDTVVVLFTSGSEKEPRRWN